MKPHLLLLLLLSFLAAMADAEEADEAKVDFAKQIRPLLSDRCFACHGPDENARQADLRLDIRAEAIDLGAINPKDPEGSQLIDRIFSDDESELMPPPDSHKKLDAAEKELLRRWIAEGAEYQSHWAYVELDRPETPKIKNEKCVVNPIDQFIGQKLEQENVNPNPPADRVTLIRRLSFDLTGLPPTPAEVDAFVNDGSDEAYGKLVDRLLDSPRFGERMAIYWLDLVRYADTVGYHGDQNVAHTLYRDYVIDAFNSNKPYGQFVREQLAGDLLPEPTTQQLIATGYNRLNQTTEEGGAQPKEYLAIYFADRVRNVSQVFMGATMGCAQCHDHKFDPYTTRDFYSLGAFFADVEEVGKYGARERPPMLRFPTEQQKSELAELDRKISELKKAIEEAEKDSDPDNKKKTLTSLNDEQKNLQSKRESIDDTVKQTVITNSVKPREIRVLRRGNWMDEGGEIVQPAIPAFLGTLDTDGQRATRLNLANWLCESDNVLTSRTMANRLWYLMFGRGICTSVDDFGSQGTFPSHPDLLDWLAVEFVESGWDIKHTLRTIVTSSTYRQSSKPTDHLKTVDPYNDWFARQGRFRIDAEMVRDNAMMISGLLVEHLGGVSAKPYQPKGYYAELNFPTRTYQPDSDKNQYRRGVYTHWQRTFLHPMLKAFDAPSREECTAARPRSNTPLQALTLLNDPTFVEAARVFAARIIREAPANSEKRIEWAYRQAVSRYPSQRITAELKQLFDKHSAFYSANTEQADKLIATGNAPVDDDLEAAELAAWTSVARVFLNLHETITRY